MCRYECDNKVLRLPSTAIPLVNLYNRGCRKYNITQTIVKDCVLNKTNLTYYTNDILCDHTWESELP